MKEDKKPNLMIEMAELMGKRQIVSSSVLKSIKSIAKKAHVWVLQDEVFVIQQEKKRFISFENFTGEQRGKDAFAYAKSFVIKPSLTNQEAL